MNFTFVALRSKISGRFFEFVEYTEDGWGKYEDNITETDIADGHFPHLISLGVYGIFLEKYPRSSNEEACAAGLTYELKDHSFLDVELVWFNLHS